ncbi:hypothetical protein J6590_024071 [Homalodisca vitripennis]|nr:hypothetical protein J6590_024071 [Homalodisca vitripennis]
MFRNNPISKAADNISSYLLLLWPKPRVVECFTSPVTVRLVNPTNGNFLRKVHVSQLKKFFMSKYYVHGDISLMSLFIFFHTLKFLLHINTLLDPLLSTAWVAAETEGVFYGGFPISGPWLVVDGHITDATATSNMTIASKSTHQELQHSKTRGTHSVLCNLLIVLTSLKLSSREEDIIILIRRLTSLITQVKNVVQANE